MTNLPSNASVVAHNNGMNTSRIGINTLAQAALDREFPPALSVSSQSSFASQAQGTNMKLTSTSDPNLMAAIANARRVSMPNIMPAFSTSMTQCLPNGSRGNAEHSIYLSILNDQRRRSETDLKSVASATTRSIPLIAPSNTGIIGSDPANVAPPLASSVSSASNYASMMQTQFDSTVTAPSRRRKPNFAEKLHTVLNDQECRHAIAWLPSGRSFCITDQDEFVKNILPKYFREAKFESFSRRLKRWGFRKVYTTGLSQIIFSHDLFRNGRPDLCKIMNGREKIFQGAGDNECTSSMAARGGADRFACQNQFRNAMILQQAQQKQKHQATFQTMQQMNHQREQAALVSTGNSPKTSFHSNNVMGVPLQGTSSSPSGGLISIDARTILNEAHALASRSMPQVPQDPQVALKANDPSKIFEAKMQLSRLNDDIVNCEEQLIILQQLKDLKDMRRQLTEPLRGVAPSSA